MFTFQKETVACKFTIKDIKRRTRYKPIGTRQFNK